MNAMSRINRARDLEGRSGESALEEQPNRGWRAWRPVPDGAAADDAAANPPSATMGIAAPHPTPPLRWRDDSTSLENLLVEGC